MAFRFSLAAVLRVRESIEQREERALQRIQHEMARVLHQIEDLSAAIAKAHDAREEALQQPIPAGHLHSLLWEAEAAAERRKALVHTLQALEQQRDKQMKIYQAAHRSHETLISMLRGQRNAYELEQARAQQKYIDDIFMARRHRS
jgi:flagellar FliJ protein